MHQLLSEGDNFTTGFADTRLWKTKHLRKRFQNSRQSYVLLTDRIEIGFRSDMSITRKIDGNFGKVSAAVLFSKVAYQGKRW